MVWGALEDRRDQLRLLAMIAQGLGAKGLRTYRPASAALEEALAEPPPSAGTRELEVAEFVSKTGGEAG